MQGAWSAISRVWEYSDMQSFAKWKMQKPNIEVQNFAATTKVQNFHLLEVWDLHQSMWELYIWSV